MAIVINIDVMLAKRKMSVTELSEKLGITIANVSILKNGKAKALIYVSGDSEILKAKAMSLIGYVNIYYNCLDIKIMIKKFKRKARENGGI